MATTKTNATLEPVDEYAITGVSCPDLCLRYGVEVREFVLLACLKDLASANPDKLGKAVGLSRTTVDSCITNLLDIGLVQASDDGAGKYQPTADGRALLRGADDSAHGA